jgi:hypothetical protein
MSESLPENWQIFIEQYPQFMKLQRKLATTDWFSQGGWSLFIGHYHAGIYAQIYKANWFNYSLDGIHFEAGITAESLKDKVARLDLHVGHRNLFDREKFNELTIPRMTDVVATWEGDIRFSTTNLSDRLSLEVPFTKTHFAEQLTNAFTQLSSLAPIIDDGLAQL